MAITRNFKETVQARALHDLKFREGMLRESIESMLAGDLQTGKALLRGYIKMTKNKVEKSKKEIEQLLKAIKRKPIKLNCVATDKCQINFEQPIVRK